MKRLYATSLFAITLSAFVVAAFQSQLAERETMAQVELRAVSLLAGLEEAFRAGIETGKTGRLERLATRLQAEQKISGVTVCENADGAAKISSFPPSPIASQICAEAARNLQASTRHRVLETGFGERLLLSSRALEPLDLEQERLTGKSNLLVLTQNLSFLESLWVQSFLQTAALVWLCGVLLFLLITSQVNKSIRGYSRFLYQTLRSLAAGRRPNLSLAKFMLEASDLVKLPKDFDQLTAKILTLPSGKRRASQRESQPRTKAEELRQMVQDRSVLIVANREPYIHQRGKDGDIKVIRPASGLVTALEPILRQCGGLWLAHGSGSADRETSNPHGEIAVPPGNPKYTLKRVWLTPEEEQGYYYGFSNEGLWPLCHLAHTRPIFRLTDWEKYCTVNARFCAQTPESALSPRSLVLVQDYHFAILPRLLKHRAAASRRASPRIGLFWHIPWPNPEAFGICPWNRELLRGMLGADVVGFHTQYHCNNFLETCDRYLEARIDWERFSVTMDNHETLIRPFPIGIDTSPVRTLSDEERTRLKARYGIKAEFIAVGVDRIDYTKGLVERVEGVERFLEKYPQYVGRFSLVQMGSPSRTNIPAYQLLHKQLQAAVERVNGRFGEPGPNGYQPVTFLSSHHEWEEIQYFYQLGDLCMVTSLHDGMNLVAKEYIWCQSPERGALVLSKFTGASRELTDAFIVNPYSIEEIAEAIAGALALSPSERARRMSAMKAKIESKNAFHWANDLIRALVNDVRPDEAPRPLRTPRYSATHPR